MNHDARIDPLVERTLVESAPSRAPDRLLHDVASATSHQRQRPRWLASLKEPPMRYRSNLVVGSPTARRTVVLATMLLLALVAMGAAVAGASLLPVPDQPLRHNGLIAFDSGDGNIYVSGPDGSDPRVLVDLKNPVRGPSWSPDGTHLAFYEVVGSAAYRDTLANYNTPDRSLIDVVDAGGNGDVELTGADPGHAPPWLGRLLLRWRTRVVRRLHPDRHVGRPQG